MKIIVYGSDTCSWCRAVEDYFKEKKISYNYVDVSKDELAMELIIDKTGQSGIPVTNINGNYIVGYNKEKIDKFLG